MADEETTAVIEPESPPAESPPAAIEPPPTLAPPDEAVPAPEQEQHEGEKPEGDSGTPAAEDEAPTLEQVREQYLADLAEQRKADPELDARIKAQDPTPDSEETVGTERLEFEREKGRDARKQAYVQAAAVAESYSPQALWGHISAKLNATNEGVISAAKDLQAGKADDAGAIRFDVAAVTNEFAQWFSNGQDALRLQLNTGTNDIIVGALEGHATYAYLSTDERGQLRELARNGKYDEAIELSLNAAIRAADPEKAKAAKATAEKDAGLVDKYAKLSLGIGKSGKPGGGAATKTGPTTLEEIDDALRTGPTADIDGLLRRRAELTE